MAGLLVVQDITGLKRMEESLLEKEATLAEREAALRTALTEKEAALSQTEAAVDAVRQGEERYRTLFTGMREGFALHEILCDAQGKPCDYRFLDANPAFEALTGLKAEQIPGAPYAKFCRASRSTGSAPMARWP